MNKLFIIGIGGSVKKANIEVHDILFVVASSIEETHDRLKEHWYGTKLHMDTYHELKGTVGYAIELKEVPQESELQLYFVNMGGYSKEVFGERHECGFIVAADEKTAKAIARETLLHGVDQKHVDNIRNVQKNLIITGVVKQYLHLAEDTAEYSFKPDWNGYLKLI